MKNKLNNSAWHFIAQTFLKRLIPNKNFRFQLAFVMIMTSHYLTIAQSNHDCGQAIVTNKWLQQHPQFLRQYDSIQVTKQLIEKNLTSSFKKQMNSAPTYTIPLVFHIIHLGGSENISDAQIQDQVAILNRDYQKLNADTAVIAPSFTNNIANVGFAFKLATIDPNGNCTNGIVRHYNYKTNWDANNLNDFIFSWPTDKYLNIYVVKTININATAYTFLPGVGVPPDADVIVAMHNMVGSMGTGTVGNSRVLTHEVAHWFDIQHIWGISNAPGVACGDDLVNDTPITKGFSTCNTSASNVCDPLIYENVQNYMDYSPCKIMFTNGQAQRMYATIVSNINNRGNVISTSNLIATGVIGTNSCATVSDFYSSKTMNCAGNTFTFTSLSQFGNTGGSLLWSFPGGTPSSSTNSVEVVTYNTPGTYTVSLTATGINGSDTETKNDFITVSSGTGGQTVPFAYDFEASTLPSSINIFNEQADTIFWKQNSLLGASSSGKCIYLNNFPDSTNYGNRDYFETPYFDLTNTSNLTFSFYYAYAKKFSTQADSFRVQYSTDCGGSWTSLLGIPNMNTMAANSGGTLNAAFIPTPSQWKLVSLPAVLLSSLNNKPSVKFRFFFKSDYYVNGSNNIYIDQINLNGNITTGISDLENSIAFNMYPNPSSGDVIINVKAKANQKVSLNVFDVTGRCLFVKDAALLDGEELHLKLNNEFNLTSGLYFVNVRIGNKHFTKKLVIEE
ncbi:MAG: M43 family zinc metalloprotease [Bacteroidia bacterium]